MNDIVEIRWHGRGGQGAKTASLLLADAAFNTGKYVQGFPEYGPERMGAPITAYNRISTQRSTVHSNIYFPDYVVVVDETLLHSVDVTAGQKPEGAIVINSGKTLSGAFWGGKEVGAFEVAEDGSEAVATITAYSNSGDIGFIVGIDPENETLTVDFDGKIAVYGFDSLLELEHAWAMTVHKSQGSEYRAVILALSSGSQMLMTRSVLYTAVTRARELLIMVGDDNTACQMIDNFRQSRRYTALRIRLRELSGIS